MLDSSERFLTDCLDNLALQPLEFSPWCLHSESGWHGKVTVCLPFSHHSLCWC